MRILKNAWYPIAWQSEIDDKKLLARSIANTPLVLFRDEQGRVTALEDICPHRAAPLSMGKLENCTLRCPYHGLRFNAEGECVENPQGNISKRAKVSRFSTTEKYAAVWVWMGDETKADPGLIPEFNFMNEDEFYIGKGYMKMGAHYELESDNILDLSHIEFLHPIFSSPAVSAAPSRHEEKGETVWSRRMIENDTDVPQFLKNAFQLAHANSIDRWLNVRWNPPALMALWSGAVESGQPVDVSTEVPNVHWFTPESETETHYFFSISFPKSLGPHMKEVAERDIKTIGKVFEDEDRPMLEAQQKRLGKVPINEKIKVFMPGDAAAVCARRILDGLIKKEEDA
jgi:vanillate O-demethylase monooxygenase subunit